MSEAQREQREYLHYFPNDEELEYATESIASIRSRPEEDEESGEANAEKQPNSSNSIGENSPAGQESGPPTSGEKVHLFHPSVSHLRRKVLFVHLRAWFLLWCLVISMFSVYWGALYDRAGNLHRLKMLVVVEDSSVVEGIEPLIGEQITNLLTTAEFRALGTWEIYNTTDSINKKFENPSNITEAVIHAVHRRKYWSAVHVFPNTTYKQYQLYRGDTNEIPLAVQFVYESGRDLTTVKSFVVTSLQKLQASFDGLFGTTVAQELVSKLSDQEKTNLISNATLVTTLPGFQYFDNRPYNNLTLLAPLQVGLIYLIILSFFLFNFFAEVQKLLFMAVHAHQALLYRVLLSHLSYLIISLAISTVSAIFHIDFNETFGRAGFVVYWFSAYLTMAAVGGANENMALLIFTYNPPLLGFWLLSFVILNVSPSFSPMDLISPFYRYGYMMPIYHAAEIFKIIFLNLDKSLMGLHYGILVAWIVINTLLLPFILKHIGGVMQKRALAANAAKST